MESEMVKIDNHEDKNTSTSRLECLKCDKTFLYKIGYKKHIKKHEGNLTFSDSVSEYANKTKPEEKSNQCNICLKIFATSHYLKIHLNIHTGTKPKKCNYCEKAFVDPSSLVNHERVHTGERPFQCKYSQLSI